MRRAHNNLLILILSVFLLCAGYVLLPSVLLWRTGETQSPRAIAEWQQKTKGLWDSIILMSDAQEIAYKAALIELRKPDVIVFGSSVVLGLRQKMFTKPFVNMGRGIDYFRLDEEIERIIKIHAPKLVIYAPDLNHYEEKRFFTGAMKARLGPIATSSSHSTIPSGISRAWAYVLSGKLPPGNVWDALVSGKSLPGPRIGLRGATINYGGYGPDGSYYYFENYQKPEHYTSLLETISDTEISNVLARDFGETPVLSKEAILRLQRAIDFLNQNLIDFIIYLPAHAHRHAAAISNNPKYKHYFEEMAEQVKGKVDLGGGDFFNFTDPNTFDAKYEEFQDYIHVGDVGMARLLRTMAQKSVPLSTKINQQFLDAFIQKSQGCQQADIEFITRFIP